MTEEGTFTLEDAKNDGVIKSELMDKVPGMVQREFGDLVQYYQEACKHTGIPWRVALVDDLVRLLNNQAFADKVAETEVELRSVKMAEHREEDLEYVMRLREQFSEDDDMGIDVEGLISRRLEMTSTTTMGAMADGIGEANDESEQEKMREIIREEVSKAVGSDTGGEMEEQSGGETDDRGDSINVSGSKEDENRSLLDDDGSEEGNIETDGTDPITPQEGTTNVG